jgi:hypothetical protein
MTEGEHLTKIELKRLGLETECKCDELAEAGIDRECQWCWVWRWERHVQETTYQRRVDCAQAEPCAMGQTAQAEKSDGEGGAKQACQLRPPARSGN